MAIGAAFVIFTLLWLIVPQNGLYWLLLLSSCALHGQRVSDGDQGCGFDRITSFTVGTLGENSMNNSITKHNPSNSIFERQTSGLASETRQLISLGHRHNWPFQVLGKAPMLQEPVRLGDWLLVPAQDDSTKVPERAMAKIQAIFAAGIRPQVS